MRHQLRFVSIRAAIGCLLLVGAATLQLKAQTLPVGELREEQLRIQQLFNDSLSISFSNRPVWKQTYDAYLPDSRDGAWWNQQYDFLQTGLWGDRLTIGLYEPVMKATINTKIPYGENNGAAWYGRGLNTEFRAGAFLTSDYLTVTFRPHLIYSQNKDFIVPRFVPRDNDGNVLYGHEELGFGIDNPFRFGPDAFSTFDLGHSSVRLHYKALEAGLSNEPLWWGPGVRYALVLSNNAPGLKHTFIGTRYPLQIPLNIGQLEFKLIGAWPEDSEYFANTSSTDRQRFMNGFNLVYSPSFAPGLHLGFTRVSHTYVPEEGLGFSDFTKALPFAPKQPPEGGDAQNELVSAYVRWVFPESHAEIYGEYYREDAFRDARDVFLEPGHDRAYTLGFQKIIPSDWFDFDFFKVNFEINSLVPNRTDEVRPQTYYYTHGEIREGHTNGGQLLGAAIGPGSESQFLGVEGYFPKGKVGLLLQRVVVNDYFHYEFNQRYLFPTGTGNKDYYNHRANLNIGINGAYKIGPILLSGKAIWQKAFNYGRFDLGERQGTDVTYGEDDIINMQFSLSARYLF